MNRIGIENMGVQFISENDDWFLVYALGNVPMYLRKDDESVTPSIKNLGYWESWISAWAVNEIVKQDTFFIDIGANAGYYGFLAGKFGAEVVMFECNPNYVKMLDASINLQAEVDKFSLIPKAASDTVGEAVLTVPSALQGSATIRDVNLDSYNPYSFTVETTTLDLHIPKTKRKVLVKVDAEGAEEMIWHGSEKLREQHAPVFMIEYTPGAYTETFLSKLRDYGDINWINHEGIEIPIDDNTILSQTDWIMLVIRPRG